MHTEKICLVSGCLTCCLCVRALANEFWWNFESIYMFKKVLISS